MILLKNRLWCSLYYVHVYYALSMYSLLTAFCRVIAYICLSYESHEYSMWRSHTLQLSRNHLHYPTDSILIIHASHYAVTMQQRPTGKLIIAETILFYETNQTVYLEPLKMQRNLIRSIWGLYHLLW